VASELGRARLLPKEVITTFAREQLHPEGGWNAVASLGVTDPRLVVRESPQELPTSKTDCKT